MPKLPSSLLSTLFVFAVADGGLEAYSSPQWRPSSTQRPRLNQDCGVIAASESPL